MTDTYFYMTEAITSISIILLVSFYIIRDQIKTRKMEEDKKEKTLPQDAKENNS